MRRFIVNCALFIILVFAFLIGSYILSDSFIKQRKQELFTIKGDIKTIFAGDSNVECAVNDSLISNSINIAQSGEAYLYTYVKLKSILEYNDQINTVFLGFSFVDLIKDTEERWLFKDEFVIEKIKMYNYLLNNSEKSLIIKNNPKAYLTGAKECIISNFLVFLKSYTSEVQKRKIINFGGYERVVLDKLQEDIKRNAFSELSFERGLHQEEYLKLISFLCRQKSIKLILINTPKHQYYSTRFNKEIKNDWLLIRNSLSQDSLLDLSSLPMPDSCYYDMDHLNFKGAKIFSDYLNNKLHPRPNEYLTKMDKRIIDTHSFMR
jgi:hypothetical protein